MNINEFKTSGEIVSMGIDKIKFYKQTKKWLSSYVFNNQIIIKNFDFKNKYTIVDIKGDFILLDQQNYNALTELPEFIKFDKIYGDFILSARLTTLDRFPEYVKGNLYISNNNLTELNGLPKQIDKDLFIKSNSKKFNEDEIRSICKVNGNIYI